MNLITQAIARAGHVNLVARACNVTYQCVRQWERNGRLPRTDLTGETNYAELIARSTKNKITKEDLLKQSRRAWQR